MKDASPGTIGGQELLQLVQQRFTFVDAPFARTAKAEQQRRRSSPGASSLQDEDEEDTSEDEDQCRRSLEEAMSATMQSHLQSSPRAALLATQRLE